MKSYIIKGVLSALLLLFSIAYSQNNVQSVKTEITRLHQTFEEILKKTPNNKGARNLSNRLKEVELALDQYAHGQMNQADVQKVVTFATAEAKRYSSENAKAVLKQMNAVEVALKAAPTQSPETQIVENLKQEPARPTPSEPDPVEDEASLHDDENDGVAVRVRPQPDVVEEAPQKAGSWLMPTLLVLYLSALLLFCFYLMSLLRKTGKRLESRMNMLEAHLRDMALSPSSAGGGDKLNLMQQQLERKLEMLEKNTTDFLNMFEAKLVELERDLGAINAEPQAATVNGSGGGEFLKYKDLETRLAELEQMRQAQASAGFLPAVMALEAPFDAFRAEVLLDALQRLAANTDIHRLKSLCTGVAPLIRNSILASTWQVLDLYALAEIVQLAFVSSYNEQQDDAYQQIIDVLSYLGFTIQEKVVGQPLFGFLEAENIGLEDYLDNQRLQSDEYPNTMTVQRQIENKFGAPIHAPGASILSVLKPAVYYLHHQHPYTLLRGVYVVNGSMN